MLFSVMATPVYILTNSVCWSRFLTSSPLLVISSLFDNSHSKRHEVVSHCGFGFHFSDDINIFSCMCLGICVSPLGECLFRSYAHLLIRLFGFFVVELYQVFVYFEY